MVSGVRVAEGLGSLVEEKELQAEAGTVAAAVERTRASARLPAAGRAHTRADLTTPVPTTYKPMGPPQGGLCLL